MTHDEAGTCDLVPSKLIRQTIPKPMATFSDRSLLLGWLFLALLSFAGIRPAAARFPVPRRYDGFLYGTEAKDGIVIEAFLDIL
jgi:hypothetical protein